MDGTQGRQGDPVAMEEDAQSPPEKVQTLIAPHELEVLKSYEMAELADAGDFETLRSIAERLIEGVLHCRDPAKSIGTSDIQPNEYRKEVLLCALTIFWIIRLEGPPSLVLTAKEAKALITDTEYTDTKGTFRIFQWILSLGSNKTDEELYRLACGRAMAAMAHACVSGYRNVTTPPHNTENGKHAAVLTTIIVNMAQNCSWKRTKDQHLFQQVKSKLDPARMASILYHETPMAEIAAELDPQITNRVVGDIVAYDVGRKLKVAKFETTSAVDLFVAAVGVLRENLDADVPLYINTEIPYARSDTQPSFVLLTGSFATRGTRFGYIKDGTMHFVDPSSKNIIMETILMWMNAWLQADNSPALQMLHTAVSDPERIMQVNKFYKYVHGIDFVHVRFLSLGWVGFKAQIRCYGVQGRVRAWSRVLKVDVQKLDSGHFSKEARARRRRNHHALFLVALVEHFLETSSTQQSTLRGRHSRPHHDRHGWVLIVQRAHNRRIHCRCYNSKRNTQWFETRPRFLPPPFPFP